MIGIVRPVTAQTLIGNVPIGNNATFVNVNTATNMIYVTNFADGTVTAINGATDATSTIHVGNHDEFLVINQNTNKIYVNNRADSTVSVINGATNQVIKTISGFSNPIGSDVNPVTNRIYVANSGNGTDNTVGVIDGNTDTLIATVTVGLVPIGVAVNPVTNKIYVYNQCGNSNNCTSNGTVTVIDGATNQTTSIDVDWNPAVILVNTQTNKIYVVNNCGNNSQSADCLANGTVVPGTVSVIDGATNQVQRVNVGNFAAGLFVNAVSNEAYVVNQADNDISIINGSTLATTTVATGNTPADVEADPNTYKIYVTNYADNTITMIDGATHHTSTLGVGAAPAASIVNPVTNRYYVTNTGDNTASVIAGGQPSAIQFVAVTPCRLIDTRNSGGPISGGTSRSFTVSQLGSCGIPATAAAYSLNVTVVPNGAPLGYLTIWPTGAAQPVVSTMNSTDGRTKANAAFVPGGYQGAVSVYVSNTTNVVLDINGYFTGPGGSTLQFYPLTPCRVIDTRNPNGNLGGPALVGATVRSFDMLSSSCIPQSVSIAAYSLNFTAIPYPSGQAMTYLSAWPEGENQPTVSTLNNPTATNVANAAIVPAGSGGGMSVYPSQSSNLAVDINGYFAAPGTGGLSLYAGAPCRVVDTRQSGGAFQGEQVVNVEGSDCTLPSTAQGYVFNATVIPQDGFHYLTLWPDGEPQPGVSTLNAADGRITSNMAIVPTTNGKVDAFAQGSTNLILDISGYFAP